MYTRLSTMFAATVFSALLSGCGGSSGVPGPAPTMGPPNFLASYGGYFQPTGGNPPASVIIAGTGVGADTQGGSHASFSQQVVFSTSPNQINNGKFTFTFTDGSTLTGTYAGTSTPPDGNGYSNGSGRFTVQSGTGRFANTAGNTGTWKVSVQIFPPGRSPAGTINATFQGTLSL